MWCVESRGPWCGVWKVGGTSVVCVEGRGHWCGV